MAMDASVLGTEIAAALDALTEAQLEDTEQIWTAISGAIISHIQTSAEIAPLDVDLDPADGTPEGETLAATAKIS